MTGNEPPSSGLHGVAAPIVQKVGDELRLVVDGAVQSVLVREEETPHGYWRALVPARPPVSALILGFGGGTVAHLLRRGRSDLPITGVDDDHRVLALARRYFGIEAAGIAVVEADARQFVRACRDRYDLVIVDLFRGETIAGFAGQGEFIRRVRSLVEPGGSLVWNLHRDRRGRAIRQHAGRGLRLERRVLAGLNLVLHFRRRRHKRILGADESTDQ